MYKVEWKHKNRLLGLLSALGTIDKKEVSFGFFESQGKHPYHPKYTLPEIMAMNELSEPPTFPVFKVAVETYGKKFELANEIRLRQYFNRAAKGRSFSAKRVLNDIGRYGVFEVLTPVFGNTTLLGSNAQFTIEGKGGNNNPMIETAYMLRNIQFKTTL